MNVAPSPHFSALSFPRAGGHDVRGALCTIHILMEAQSSVRLCCSIHTLRWYSHIPCGGSIVCVKNVVRGGVLIRAYFWSLSMAPNMSCRAWGVPSRLHKECEALDYDFINHPVLTHATHVLPACALLAHQHTHTHTHNTRPPTHPHPHTQTVTHIHN